MTKRIAKRLEDRIKVVFTWIKDQVTTYPYLLMTTVGILLIGYLLIARFGLGSSDWADWAGFGPHISPDNNYYRPAKTLWDSLDLLIIPLVLAVGAWLLNKSERKSDRQIALDRQWQATLQAYYDRMTDLLLDRSLREASEGQPVCDVARAQTLTTLRNLDSVRRGQVIQFLCEARLLSGAAKVVLRGAQLEKVDLVNARLSGSDLWSVNLKGANLEGANLWDVSLEEADLEGANLQGAELGKATLSFAKLTGANLQGAKYNNDTLWPEGFNPIAAGAILVNETVEEEEDTA